MEEEDFFPSGYMGIPGARFVTLKDTPLCAEEVGGEIHLVESEMNKGRWREGRGRFLLAQICSGCVILLRCAEGVKRP